MKQKAQTVAKTAAPARQLAVWSGTTRLWVVIGLVVLAAIIIYWIRDTFDSLIFALLIAYLLNPLVAGLSQRLRLPRIAAAALIYLALLAAIVVASVTITPILVRQVSNLPREFNHTIEAIGKFLEQSPQLAALGIKADAATLTERIRVELTTLGARVPSVLLGAASSVFSLVFILVMSFYLVKDADKLNRAIEQAAPEGYRDDAQRIMAELNTIWSSFLRGQVILALVIGAVTTVALYGLGVPNALLLGLLAGLMEVVPTLGPIIAMVPAVLVAFFQGSSLWPLDPAIFAVVVLIAYLLIQQLENHLVVPMVLGQSVDLPPVVVLFGAFAGASLAGVLGIFLAAPVLATVRAIGQFIYKKLIEPLPSRET
jgi:predicted PurR-regulated permease PerM